MSFSPTPQELSTARQMAWQVGRRWPSVELDDLRQHLLLWVLEHGEQVERFRTKENAHAALAISLKREALRYCTKESAARQGKSVDRDNFYTEEVVSRALPFLFQAWPETHVRENPTTGRAMDKPFNSGDALAIMADIQSAFRKLPPQTQMVLELRFREDLTLDEVGRRLEISNQAVDQTVAKAVKQMSESLSR